MNPLDAKQLVRRLIDEEFSSATVSFGGCRAPTFGRPWPTSIRSTTASATRSLTSGPNGGVAMLTPVDYEQQTELVQHPAYQRYTAAVCGPCAWTYADPSFVRSIIEAQAQIPADWEPAEPPDLGLLPMEAVENAPSPQTARAPDIRREVKRQFQDRFRIQPTNKGGGAWAYAGDCDGRAFTPHHRLRRFRQVPVWSRPSRSNRKAPRYGVAWEGLLGFGLGGWDFVCAHNLNASVSLLGEVIEKLVPLLEEVDGQRDR